MHSPFIEKDMDNDKKNQQFDNLLMIIYNNFRGLGIEIQSMIGPCTSRKSMFMHLYSVGTVLYILSYI